MQNHPRFREFQQSMAIIFFAMLGGQVVFSLVSLGLVSKGFVTPVPGFRETGLLIVPLLVFSGYMAGRLLGKKMMEKAMSTDDVEEKLNLSRTALIIRLAALETPGLFAIVAFLFTGERLFLGFTGVLLFYFITLFPSDARIISDLDSNSRRK